MANVIDLLGSSTLVTKRNSSMSSLYMLYQLLSLASSILAPSTVILMIAGSLTLLFNIHPNVAIVLSVIPPAILLGISFKIKSDIQIHIAGVLSVLYAFLMMIAAITIVANIVRDQTILTPSSLFLIILSIFYIVTAVLHPQEISLVFYGFLYILCTPSAYLLLAIYSMVNMNNVSWGTRETAPAAGAAKPAAATPITPAKKGKSTFRQFFSKAKCCGQPCCRGSAEEVRVAQRDLKVEATELQPQPQNTIVQDMRQPEEEEWQEEPASICLNQSWVTQLQSLSDDMYLKEETLDEDEEQFFREMTAKYLEPLPENKKKQKEMADNLKHLRNKITFVYFVCNAFWLVATFALQLLEDSMFIQVPKLDINLQATGEFISIDPLGFMFILAFIILFVIQFIAMLYHRINTLIHFVAFLDTENKSEKQKQRVQQVEYDSIFSDGDYMFPSVLSRNYNLGTLV